MVVVVMPPQTGGAEETHRGRQTPGCATDCGAARAPGDSPAVPRALALLALLALAGCGAAHRRSDTEIARRAGLTLRDLPSGWKPKSSQRLIDCPAFRAARGTASATTRTPVFMSRGDRKELSGNVEVFASPEAARAAFLRLTAPGARGCVARTLRHTVPRMAGVRLRAVTAFVTRVDRLGDQQSGARFVVTYTYRQQRVPVYLDLLRVRAGRGIASELYVSSGAPLDGRLRYDLTALTAHRLARLQR
jgi:hypothetical protein